MYFASSLALTTLVLCVFLFGPAVGPDTFVPGLIVIWILGVVMGVAGLRADAKRYGEN